eukprot:CAMPEP_0181310706 /NCGR_PEP_ID=MMETSP1101-20121128/12733_1 /TAXON_ID=46948 /ORGANISM="Rhodomonas abbreviata, Strain Caron Lab Isolate" /LENGTH=164 /DNA_ID=CAMNT_0023417361 /DNA_START=46 /DNA_END=540 /DNA_ORIENTATION=-
MASKFCVTSLLLLSALCLCNAWQMPTHTLLSGLSLRQPSQQRVVLRGGGPRMGVEVTTTKAGDGKNYPQKGDILSMHYTGTLAKDGSKFDSSVDRGTPFKFQIGVGQVIKGWDEGVIKMSLGEKATLKISPDYGYGERGFPPVIPPSSELVFDVELLAIGDKKA